MANFIFLIFGLGPQELFLIAILILVLFGGKKIPELMRGLGKGVREFNSAKASIETEFKEGMKETEKKKVEEKREA